MVESDRMTRPESPSVIPAFLLGEGRRWEGEQKRAADAVVPLYRVEPGCIGPMQTARRAPVRGAEARRGHPWNFRDHDYRASCLLRRDFRL
jgi:hypothetical protein